MATKEEIQAMTGQKNMARAPKYLLDEVHFLGKDSDDKTAPMKAGHFKLKLVEQGKKGVKVGNETQERYELMDLGDKPLDVVFLKIRRVLSEWRPNGSLRTNEHNSKHDTVTLFGADGGPQVGTADEIRERNQGLRTQQIVYVYLPAQKKIARLVVKGLSLGSSEPNKEIVTFYEYISSFNKDKTHLHEHFTKLVPKEQGKFWGIHFERGPKLDDEKIAKVEAMIEGIHKEVTAIDAYYAEQQNKKLGGKEGVDAPAKNEAVDAPAPADVDTVEYPEEDIDVADIPF